jgi:hypothetical protein
MFRVGPDLAAILLPADMTASRRCLRRDLNVGYMFGCKRLEPPLGSATSHRRLGAAGSMRALAMYNPIKIVATADDMSAVGIAETSVKTNG